MTVRIAHDDEKDDALWLKTTSFGDEKDEVLIRSNGIPTYYAADIAYSFSADVLLQAAADSCRLLLR